MVHTYAIWAWGLAKRKKHSIPSQLSKESGVVLPKGVSPAVVYACRKRQRDYRVAGAEQIFSNDKGSSNDSELPARGTCAQFADYWGCQGEFLRWAVTVSRNGWVD